MELDWVAVISSAISIILTGLVTWRQTKSSQEDRIRTLQVREHQLKQQVTQLQAEKKKVTEAQQVLQKECASLRPFAQGYHQAREALKTSRLVKTYCQPVLLLGPRAVGKSSLLAQWHAPWDHSDLSATQTISVSHVPIYDFASPQAESHFAMPDLKVVADIHLKLKVIDFPGEPTAQQSALAIAKEEAFNLIRNTDKNLGIVLICLLDAEEAVLGIRPETRKYYNGDMFRQLRSLVSHAQINVDRIVLVFNKYDLLRTRSGPNVSDEMLQKSCVDKLSEVYGLLAGVCAPGKVCEVFSILSRENIVQRNQGAPIILGEASRAFVAAFAGPGAVRKVIPHDATNHSAVHFQL